MNNTAINSLREADLIRYNMNLRLIKKRQQQKEAQKENFFENVKMISLNNKEENKQNIQEAAKLIDKINKKDKIYAADKSSAEIIGGTVGKQVLHQLTYQEGSLLTKITEANPAAIIATFLGVEPEEDGNALKKGAVSGKGGDFSGDYKKFFENMIKNANESEKKAFLEGFNLIPNLGSIAVTNALQYAGYGVSKVFGKDTTAFVGSAVSAFGKGINAVCDTLVTAISGEAGMIKNLCTGNVKKAANAIIQSGENIAKIAISVKDKAVEVAKDAKNFAVSTGKKVASAAVAAKDATVSAVKKGYSAVKSAGKKVVKFLKFWKK